MSRVTALLERLIGVDTHNPGGDERALTTLLAEELVSRRADSVHCVEVPRAGAVGAYVFARWGTPRLLVNAHIDTVPPNAGWSRDPFVAQIERDRVIGLGAADTKGAIAAILSALDETRPRDLAVLFSGDEELSGTCMQSFIAGPLAQGIEQAIVCEPTSCRLGTRHRGIVALEAHLKGAGGHSSYADRMPAPIAELAGLATAWHDWGVRHRNSGPAGFTGMCMNIAKLDGGVAFNVVPEEARLSVSLRPPPGSDAAALRAELFAIAQTITPKATLTATLENPPFHTRDFARFERWLGPLPTVDLGFWTEAAALSEAGVDAVVFGPGDIAQAHAPDEWVAIEQLDRAHAAFVQLFAASGAHGAG